MNSKNGLFDLFKLSRSSRTLRKINAKTSQRFKIRIKIEIGDLCHPDAVKTKIQSKINLQNVEVKYGQITIKQGKNEQKGHREQRKSVQ